MGISFKTTYFYCVNMETKNNVYTVKDLCIQFSITRKTLFYYDKIGLLIPKERIGSQQHKIYNQEEYNRLKTIVELRALGFHIQEIRMWLDLQDSHKELLEQVIIRTEKELVSLQNRLINLKKRNTSL